MRNSGIVIIIFMAGESSDFLRRIVEEFFCVRGIILSDSEGLHICSSFSTLEHKEQNEKFIQTATLLISAISQTESNLHKVPAPLSRPKPTPTFRSSTSTTRSTSSISRTCSTS